MNPHCNIILPLQHVLYIVRTQCCIYPVTQEISQDLLLSRLRADGSPRLVLLTGVPGLIHGGQKHLATAAANPPDSCSSDPLYG